MSHQQTSISVSPLRRHMLDDMAMRGLQEDGGPDDAIHDPARLRRGARIGARAPRAELILEVEETSPTRAKGQSRASSIR